MSPEGVRHRTSRPPMSSGSRGTSTSNWAAWIGALSLVRENDGTTAVRGVVADQAELHGLLAKVRDLGMTLISVQAIDAGGRWR
jgi:hypothetical protein